MMRNTQGSYGSVAKWMHWLIFFMVVLMLLSGYFSVIDIPHKILGLSVLILMIFRVIWALCNPTPRLPPVLPKWQARMAHGVQWLLCVSLIAMPVSGWIMASAYGKPPHLASLYLPAPFVSHNLALAGWCWKIHSTLAIVILCCLGLHILAAGKHYFIDRDGIMQKMLPRYLVKLKPAGRKHS